MPPKRSTPKIMHRAVELRHEPSAAEIRLWGFLRTLRGEGINFRRQHAIGPYIADFCSPRSKLIIELDGSLHRDQKEYDEGRTSFLESKGYRVLRFWNNDVMNKSNEVIGMIMKELERNNW
jgi:very-short-patch-repair endonuclease